MNETAAKSGYQLKFKDPVRAYDVIDQLGIKSGIPDAKIQTATSGPDHIVIVHDGKPRWEDPVERGVGTHYFSVTYRPSDLTIPDDMDATSTEFKVDGRVITPEIIAEIQAELSGQKHSAN